uniref:Uncharacterized protein n=1 Tax=Oryza nivara TaxID=4536 RepID=A0A0E0HQT1_ORYNI
MCRCDRRGARPPCPATTTGGAWRRLVAGPDGAVVQAGSLSPTRGGGRAAPATPHVPISAASTPRWISASEPTSRARTSWPPTSSPARGDTAAGFVQGRRNRDVWRRRSSRVSSTRWARAARALACTTVLSGPAAGRLHAPLVAAAGQGGLAPPRSWRRPDEGEVKRRRTRT